jgi:DNA-binding NarL/FixJ family response regulator
MRGTIKATVILADDHAGMIDKVAEIIGQECTIIAKVSDGIASVEAAIRLQPDIIVLDIAMPKLSGIQAARELKRLGVRTKVVFLTVQEDTDCIEAASELGASFVLKPKMYPDLIHAIRETLLGNRFVSLLSTQVSSSQTERL